MPTILPGRPQSKRQAVSTAHWDGLRLVAYLSGNAAIISKGPQDIIQTIYIDNVDSLNAITIDEGSGKIAVCDDNHVYVYEPLGREEGALRWIQSYELNDDKGDVTVSSLSWGSSEELLVGGTKLLLWFIPKSGSLQLIWDQKIAYPVAIASLTYDGGLIASCGKYDRLVKVWRRLSYEVESTRFDVSYLQHPAAVTNVHWRKPWHAEQNLDSLLYTFSSDNRVRTWAYSDPHSRSVMQHISTIDMNASIQPRRLSVGSISNKRYAFIIDSRDFSSATENAVQSANSDGTDHALEHLIEIANRSPEICIVLDGIGHMSAWGLENAGCKNKLAPELFNIAHVDGMNMKFSIQSNPIDDYIQFCVFGGGKTKSSLSILVHSFAGDVDWYDCSITKLFDTSPRYDRAEHIASWAGHDDSIEMIVSDDSGRHVISWTCEGDAIAWVHQTKSNSAPLIRRSFIESPTEIIDAKVSRDGQYIVSLDESHLKLWDLRQTHAIATASLNISNQRKAVAISTFSTPLNEDDRVLILYADNTLEMYSVRFPTDSESQGRINGDNKFLHYLGKAMMPSLVSKDTLFFSNHTFVLELPAYRTTSRISALSLSRTGNFQVWEQLVNEVDLLPSFRERLAFDTNIRVPKLVIASPVGKIACVSGKENALEIWDCNTGVWETQRQHRKSETIEEVAWMTTVNGHSILVICFSYSILILGESRYSNTGDANVWVDLQTIRMRDFTPHIIEGLCCLSNGDIVVGAGSQLFVFDSKIDGIKSPLQAVRGLAHDKKQMTAVIATEIFNANLALFEPEVLNALTQLGAFKTVRTILIKIYEKLKFLSEGESLSSSLDFEIEKLTSIVRGTGHQDHASRSDVSQSNGMSDDPDEENVLSDEIARQLCVNLAKYPLWQISAQKQSRLQADVDVYLELEQHVKSVDENGLRYLHALHNSNELPLPWRAIMFASLSTSQEVLVDHVTRFFGGKLTWDAARKSGMFLWLSEIDAVRIQLESVGRAEFTKGEDRNPVDCSLFYLALGKKNVLQGLWRMTIGVKEKENTMKLLANNFNDMKWKATALKNAYALLSKRRFNYGAAFFLLGGSPKDAVNVCAHQLKDLQLAIAIARVSDKTDGSVLRTLLQQTVLESAIQSTQGRWMASWAYTMLNQPRRAVQVLIRPVHQAIGKPLSGFEGMVDSLNWRVNDPILTVLYQQLRSQLRKQNEWIGVINPKEEWDFVMRCVYSYRRMGCDFLALALVRNWQFMPESKAQTTRESVSLKSTKQVDLDGERKEEKSEAEEQGKKKKPPPTQFQEPSSSSLLDSFGF